MNLIWLSPKNFTQRARNTCTKETAKWAQIIYDLRYNHEMHISFFHLNVYIYIFNCISRNLTKTKSVCFTRRVVSLFDIRFKYEYVMVFLLPESTYAPLYTTLFHICHTQQTICENTHAFERRARRYRLSEIPTWRSSQQKKGSRSFRLVRRVHAAAAATRSNTLMWNALARHSSTFCSASFLIALAFRVCVSVATITNRSVRLSLTDRHSNTTDSEATNICVGNRSLHRVLSSTPNLISVLDIPFGLQLIESFHNTILFSHRYNLKRYEIRSYSWSLLYSINSRLWPWSHNIATKPGYCGRAMYSDYCCAWISWAELARYILYVRTWRSPKVFPFINRA